MKLPLSERPRERFLRYGADALSAAELIALLLGSGSQKRPVLTLAADLLATFGSLDQLADATLAELSALEGIGPAKALQLKAAFALAQRLQTDIPAPSCEEPSQIAAWIRPELTRRKSEAVMVLLCNIRRQIYHREIIAVGTLTEVLLHPREVFHPAIRHKAHSLILAHNHPSGDPSPSLRDGDMTRSIATAGRTLGIALEDHLIIGNRGYFSYREKSPAFL